MPAYAIVLHEDTTATQCVLVVRTYFVHTGR